MDCKRVFVIACGDCCETSAEGRDLQEPVAKRQKKEEVEAVTIQSEDFECSICYDIILEPVVGKCGHDYCKHCIDEWRKKQGSCLSCPICRETLLTSSRDTLGVCRRLREMVEKLFPEKIAMRRVRVAAILAAKAAKAAQAQAEAEAAAAVAVPLPAPVHPVAAHRASGGSVHSLPPPSSEIRAERGRTQSQSHDRSRGRSRASSSSRSRSRSRGRGGHSRGRSHRSRERRNDHREPPRNSSSARHEAERRQARPMSHRYSNQYNFNAYSNYGVHYQPAIPTGSGMYPTPPPFRHQL